MVTFILYPKHYGGYHIRQSCSLLTLPLLQYSKNPSSVNEFIKKSSFERNRLDKRARRPYNIWAGLFDSGLHAVGSRR